MLVVIIAGVAFVASVVVLLFVPLIAIAAVLPVDALGGPVLRAVRVPIVHETITALRVFDNIVDCGGLGGAGCSLARRIVERAARRLGLVSIRRLVVGGVCWVGRFESRRFEVGVDALAEVHAALAEGGSRRLPVDRPGDSPGQFLDVRDGLRDLEPGQPLAGEGEQRRLVDGRGTDGPRSCGRLRDPVRCGLFSRGLLGVVRSGVVRFGTGLRGVSLRGRAVAGSAVGGGRVGRDRREPVADGKERGDPLAPRVVVESEYRHVVDLGVLAEHVRDLSGFDVLAAGDDPVVDAVEYVEVARLVEPSHVAGVESVRAEVAPIEARRIDPVYTEGVGRGTVPSVGGV